MSISHDTVHVSGEIKTKCNASKVHYDRTVGPGHNIINIGEFVDARPPTSNKATSGCMAVSLKNATKDHTPYNCHTVPFNKIRYTSGIQHLLLLPLPQHHLTLHPHTCLDQGTTYNPLGSELNTPPEQPKQQPPPLSDTSNSGPDLNTSSLSSKPNMGQSEQSTAASC